MTIDLKFIFIFQLSFSILVYSLLYRWLIADRINKLDIEDASFYLAIPHVFRHIGLVFLVPGLVSEELFSAFSSPTAYGDLLTAILALITMYLLRIKNNFAMTSVGIFNIVGLIDLMMALSKVDAIPLLHSAWVVPTMIVPLLIVTHVISLKKMIVR